MSSVPPSPLGSGEIARDATWLAQALDPASGVVRLVAMNRDSYRAASFLDDRLLQRPVDAQLVAWPDIEAAVYFCVLEALQNVQKYAGASHAVVRLREVESELGFEVEDDGAGFEASAAQNGTGLTNMADRLDAVGGRLKVDSAPGRGTRVRGTLPVRVAVAG